MKKYNIKKISSRQKFAMSKDELDIHILNMMGERAYDIDAALVNFRELMFKFSDGINDEKTKMYIEDAIHSINLDDLYKAISRSIRALNEKNF